MESNATGRNPYRLIDPRQVRIHRRLLLVGSGPASFYRDACRLIASEPPFASTTHLVAHLLREIESAIRDVLESVTDRSGRLSTKAKSGDERHRSEIQNTLKGLGIPESDPVAQAWLRLPGSKNDYALHARAHRDTLARPRPLNQEFRAFWNEMETLLDVLLERFEDRYLNSHLLIDELLARTAPTSADAGILRNQIPNNLVAFGYFFSNLTSPAWLEPLRNEGFFRHPPDPERDDEQGTISFPGWSESQYLARMAAYVPEVILEIAFQMPLTENVRVHADLVDAALAMPPHLAVRLVPTVKIWIESPYQLRLPMQVGALVAHLAAGSENEAALDLARSLLTVLPDPRTTGAMGETDTPFLYLQPQARFDAWQYEQILKNYLPALVSAISQSVLLLLCDLLEQAVRLSQDTGDVRPEDYSYLWRPAIEDHGQNFRLHEIRDLLISAVRDTAEQLAANDTSVVRRLVQVCEGRRWHIFHRMALHLLRCFPDAAPELVAERLADRERFDNTALRHEYFLLAQRCFSRLGMEDQQKILGWIAEGPDLGQFTVSKEQQTDQQSSEDEISRHADLWRRDQLAPFHADLPSDWRRRYEELVAALGEPEHPEFLVYSSGFHRVPTTSPKTLEDLRSMNIASLVAYLMCWQPSRDPFAPSPEGLVAELTALVAADPERFVPEADQFLDLDPRYVRAFLAGLHEAVKEKRVFSWPLALEFCDAVIAKRDEVAWQDGADGGHSSMLSWVGRVVIDLITAGLEVEPVQVPFDLRELVWAVLKPPTDDSDPTPAYEAVYGGSNMDPATLSINTTRGTAMHTVMRYALWVRRQHEAAGNQARIERGFDEMPEVKEVLESHLDPAHDPSVAIRAVYGQWFPWLVLLDPRWAAQNVARVFPEDIRLQDLGSVAWETYIASCEPYDNTFAILREEYARAIGRIGLSVGDRRFLADPEQRLAAHLMNFYLRGKLRLNQPNGLLAQFYARASDELCGQALQSIGWGLNQMKKAPGRRVLNRLKRLWEWRVNVTHGATPPNSHAAELAAFGLWFASGKFDDVWAITQMKKVLELTGRADPEHLVVERLTSTVVGMPGDSVECLGRLIEGAVEAWHIYGWREHIRTILAAALGSPDDTARQAATALINRLGARGHLDFRDLLEL